jgi:hypothetical protein
MSLLPYCVDILQRISSHLTPPAHKKWNDCALLFFRARDKRSGHFDATSGESQLNGEGQVSRCNSRKVPCLRLRAHSALEAIAKVGHTNILKMISNLP